MRTLVSCRPIGAIVLGLFLALGLQASPKIGILLKAKSPFWAAAEKGAASAGEQLGVEIIVKAPPNETDITLQIQLLNGLVAQGVQAIVIAPCSKDALVEPLAAAAAKGAKIVVIDSTLASGAAYTFVGTDQTEAGRAAGVLLARLVGDTDIVSFLRHSQTSGATIQRETGALEKLREAHPKLTIYQNIFASSEKGVELERAALVLTQHPESKAILASGTPGTMAMLKALQERKLAGTIKFVGFGFNLNAEVAAAIESGTMEAWVAQQPAEVAIQGVKAALALINGEQVPAVVHTEFLVITKANLADAKVQALLAL